MAFDKEIEVGAKWKALSHNQRSEIMAGRLLIEEEDNAKNPDELTGVWFMRLLDTYTTPERIEFMMQLI